MSFIPKTKVNKMTIQLNDKNLYCRRQILQHKTNNEGDVLIYQNSSDALNIYIVELFEEKFVKEDLTKNCTDYPTETYQNYDDYDLQFGLSKLAHDVGPNFRPLWASNNMSMVTTTPTLLAINSSAFTTHWNLASGILLSDCKLPCTTVKTKSGYYGSTKTSYSGVSVIFKKDIEMPTTNFVPFDLVKFLCDIGGMLGLWLGLGAVQIGEMFIHTAKQCWQNIRGTN